MRVLPRPLLVALLLATPLIATRAVAADRFVVRINPGERLIGHVEIGPNGKIRVIDAVASRQDWLRGLAKRMNEKSVLHDDAAPQPDGPRSSVSRIVPRTDADFADVQRRYLSRYYKLELSQGDRTIP